jgi:hypothetical protein
MRSIRWARWATCALALSICGPALADRGGKSLASCTAFEQTDAGDAKVSFTIRNSCTVPVDCALSWRVVCAPESKKRRAVHPATVKLALESGSSQSAEASAAECGDAGWTIDSVLWRCEPNKS